MKSLLILFLAATKIQSYIFLLFFSYSTFRFSKFLLSYRQYSHCFQFTRLVQCCETGEIAVSIISNCHVGPSHAFFLLYLHFTRLVQCCKIVKIAVSIVYRSFLLYVSPREEETRGYLLLVVTVLAAVCVGGLRYVRKDGKATCTCSGQRLPHTRNRRTTKYCNTSVHPHRDRILALLGNGTCILGDMSRKVPVHS